MKKIPSLFKRNYSGDRLVYDEVVPGCEWVTGGEGIATEKFDGTCCLIRSGKLYKRYDRKMTRKNYKRLKNDPSFKPDVKHYKSAPPNWEAAEAEPNHHTGHWPGWIPVGDRPEDQWHREGFEGWDSQWPKIPNGTYELVGPKIQNNPYGWNTGDTHRLILHGWNVFTRHSTAPPRDFEGLRCWLEKRTIEGVVWHHPDGRMVKIRRSDFGLPWPLLNKSEEL